MPKQPWPETEWVFVWLKLRWKRKVGVFVLWASPANWCVRISGAVGVVSGIAGSGRTSSPRSNKQAATKFARKLMREQTQEAADGTD